MKCFSRKKLVKALAKQTDINEAEELVRSYPIALSEKMQVLNENEKLKALRESKANYSPFQITKVISAGVTWRVFLARLGVSFGLGTVHMAENRHATLLDCE